jgi:hypothetical protein
MSKNINLIEFDQFGHFLMSHAHANTKLRNISKIGILSDLGGPYGNEGMVYQMGMRANAGFTQ